MNVIENWLKGAKFVIILAVIFAAVCAVFIVMFVTSDRTPPEISFSAEVSYKEGDPEAVLLQGITAVDNKDGDVTKAVTVLSITPTSDKNFAKVRYMVRDSKGNSAVAEREVAYRADPSAPKEEESLLSTPAPVVTVEPEPTVTPTAEATPTPPVRIPGVPTIVLTAANATVAVGGEVDLLSFVSTVEDDEDDVDYLSRYISIDGTYDINTAGSYSLSYYVTDSDGNNSAPVTFTLVVEE